MKILPQSLKFEWDKGNKDKNFIKHQVSNQETEEVFFDVNKRTLGNAVYSENEKRYIILGKTKQQRLLFIVFTIRGKKIRVISARDLNRKERKLYEEKT